MSYLPVWKLVVNFCLPSQDTGSISDGSSGIGDSAAIRELDALNQEIEELRREKEALTAEIQQKELNIKTVNNEVQVQNGILSRNICLS